jgi:hypothetical protein
MCAGVLYVHHLDSSHKIGGSDQYLKTSQHVHWNFPQSILDLTVLHPTGGPSAVMQEYEWHNTFLHDIYTCG